MKLNHKIEYSCLAGVILFALMLRVYLPANTIFADSVIKFTDPDSYYHLGVMSQIGGLTTQVWPANDYQLWDWLIMQLTWLITLGNPTRLMLEYVAAFTTPVVAMGVIVFVYIIGKKVFNTGTGLAAALILAILPGEFLARSLLGAADHHIAEVFFTTGFFAFLVLAATARGKRWLYAGLSVSCFVAFMFTWQGYMMLVYILIPFTLLMVFLRPKEPIGGMGAGLLVALAGLRYFGLFGPSQVVEISTVSFMATAEAQSPFVGGLGDFVLMKCVITLALLVPLWNYRPKTRFTWLLFVWALMITIATLWQRRFDYYLAAPLALLMGFTYWRMAWFLYQYREKVKRVPRQILLVATATAIGVLCLPLSFAIASDLPYVPSRDWQYALAWVKDNTPADSVVLTWWDRGYWVKYIAERKPVATPSQETIEVKEAAAMLLSPTLVHNYNHLYVILDDKFIKDMPGMAFWLGHDYNTFPYAESYIFSLFHCLDGKKPIYQSYIDGNVRVWELK